MAKPPTTTTSIEKARNLECYERVLVVLRDAGFRDSIDLVMLDDCTKERMVKLLLCSTTKEHVQSISSQKHRITRKLKEWKIKGMIHFRHFVYHRLNPQISFRRTSVTKEDFETFKISSERTEFQKVHPISWESFLPLENSELSLSPG